MPTADNRGHANMWRRLPKRIARALANATWGALRRNNFVYNACLRSRVRFPAIPVYAVEYYGQFGEDLIIASLFEARAARDHTDLAKEKYLEIGGNHPFA